jgi:hypothetical protein
MRLQPLAASLILCSAVAASGCRGEKPADGSAERLGGDSGAPRRAADDWAMGHHGIGSVQVGATAAGSRAAFGEAFSPDSVAKGCHHVVVSGAPGRVLAMVVDGRIVRVETRDSSIVTDRGARIGDAEARIDSLYSGRVTVEPHKYVNGHYLIVAPETSDSTRLIFETDGARVMSFRAGLLPAVAWVEGCS